MNCSCPNNKANECSINKCGNSDNAKPLSKIFGCDKLKVCKIKGDRKLCARMAQLGVLPGAIIELICSLETQSCMVKIKGSTVSLDKLSAENILVIPA